MSFRRPFVNLICRILAFAVLFNGALAQGQNVILHLRNGDRVTGIIVSETTNQLVLSNVWVKELTVPLAQIERRESLPIAIASGGTNATTNLTSTNLLTSTNRLLGTNVLAGKLPVNTNTFWRRWSGTAAVGMDLEKGAANHELYYGKANLTYAQPYESDPKEFFRNILTYDAAYGKTSGVLSDNRMGGSSKTDFDLSRRIYVYNLGAAFYDEIQKINLHYEDGPGLGYHWFNHTNLAVNLELGANYQVEDRVGGTNTYSAYYRIGQDLTWKMNKQFSLTEKFEYFPRATAPSQYRMRFESTLTYALLLHLSYNLTVADYYDTQPTLGVPNNDLQIRTSLGVKF
ncbi:MAG TPA: DUF481 domain-containing protein [Verrucomicrobiae bacterium]|nr:DUF481 domain-containing protein [Verrucomicrobiae bacterium]